MKRMRIAAVGAVAVAIVTTSLIASAGVAVAKSATTKSSCSSVTDDHWPSWVQGRPAGIDPRTTAAIYMWHDGDGWHVRATHRNTNLRTFSGQLSTKGTFANAHAVHLEKSDQFQISKDKHAITFLFKNYGAIDGINFHTHCAPSIVFAFQSDGKTSPTSKIVIGKNSAHPRSNPFEISR